MAARSDKTIGEASNTGDRGLPSPYKDSSGNYAAVALDASGNVPVSGTVTATPSGTQDVNQTQINGIAVSTGSGVLGTGTQRVVLATDQPAIPTITTVTAVTSITNALPAGTNAIGKLSANSGVDIGDVDVTSLPALPSGTNNIGDVDIASIAAGDNNIGNVDVVTLPSIPAGSNSIGVLGANSGVDIGDVTINNASGASAVNIQDGGNSITVDGTITATPTGTQDINQTQINGVSVSTGAGAVGTGTQRVSLPDGMGKTIINVSGSIASSGNNTIVAADASNRIKVFALALTMTSTTATTILFQDGASGTELWRYVLQAPSSVSVGANISVSPPAYLFATSSNTLLNINLSGAITINYSLAYFKDNT